MSSKRSAERELRWFTHKLSFVYDESVSASIQVQVDKESFYVTSVSSLPKNLENSFTIGKQEIFYHMLTHSFGCCAFVVGLFQIESLLLSGCA